jgi:hypothetical protein
VPHPSLRFRAFDACADVPNVVVDGAPGPATVLALTHWPGIPQPPGMGDDLSAQMAFRHLHRPVAHPPASFVTTNHFDQDGLVSVFALCDPGAALDHEELLVDLAAAGDFATYRDRRAARASMALWAYADLDRSPIAGQLAGPYPAKAAALYEATLPLLLSLLTEPDRFRELWAEEDEHLAAGERAVADGRVTIAERPDVGLAVVTVPEDERGRWGHRFGHETFAGVHPMAVHNATDRVRLLVGHGRRWRFVDRYETWVQYHSRPQPRRVDMAPLAEQLSALETGSVTWQAQPPSALVPVLAHDGESSLAPATIEAAVVEHLRTAASAWEPFSVEAAT